MSADTYFTGKPCKRGHLAPRFVSTRNCVECNRERGRISNMTEQQLEVKRATARVEYWKDPSVSRERVCLAGQRHYERYPKRALANTRLQQIQKQQRTPKWADLKAIRAFYEACPNGYEVDHIIPLKGKNVSGLHVLNNLQYLTQKENRSKGNSF